MSMPAVLIATAKVRPGCEDAFTAWKARHDAAIARFPGYVSGDIMPPDEYNDMWTIMMNFKSDGDLKAWQQSKERAAVVGDLLPLVSGGDLGSAMDKESSGAQPATNVTQVIMTRIKPGMEDGYREWAARMQREQSKYPGYKGMYLQPPTGGGRYWTTLLRFDTGEHLEAWLAAPERATMLQESKKFVENEELLRLATSFPGWVPINPLTGKGPPGWKTALLVLLGLYPIVVLELHFFKTPLPPALDVFVENLINVTVTSFVTMPLLVRLFSGWLFADKNSPRGVEAKGHLLLGVIFAGEIFLSWLMFSKIFPHL